MLFSGTPLPYLKSMDKLFECKIIKQDSILCKRQSEVLPNILEFLQPIDVVHLSHTCKELHQKLPFFLIKSGNFTVPASEKIFSAMWFKGSPINFSVNKMNIFMSSSHFSSCVNYVWIQIIRSRTVVLETPKRSMPFWNLPVNFQFTKKNTCLRELEPRDVLCFMGGFSSQDTKSSFDVKFIISLQLESYKYDKPLHVTKRAEGYAGFKSPHILVELPAVADQSPLGDSYF